MNIAKRRMTMYVDKDRILRDVPVPFRKFNNNDDNNQWFETYCPNDGDYRIPDSKEKKIIYLK